MHVHLVVGQRAAAQMGEVGEAPQRVVRVVAEDEIQLRTGGRANGSLRRVRKRMGWGWLLAIVLLSVVCFN
jgi:hypothetical protein